jgi:hypothetical protein
MMTYLRGKSWCDDFRFRGRRYVEYLGPVTKATAKRVDLQRRVEVAEGRFVTASAPVPTFEAFAMEFMEWYHTGHRPASVRRYVTVGVGISLGMRAKAIMPPDAILAGDRRPLGRALAHLLPLSNSGV